MRRLSLSAKLFVAVLPLLVAVGTLLTLSIRSDFADVADARRGAQLGSTWEPLAASIHAVESEHQISDAGDQDAIDEARGITDSSISDLQRVVGRIGDSDSLILKIGSATRALSAGRTAVDSGDETQITTATQSFDNTERHLIGLGVELPDEASEAELGRTLIAVAALATIEQTANDIVGTIGDWPASGDPSGVVEAAVLGEALPATVDEFEKAAPDAWLAEFRGGRFAQGLSASMNDVDDIIAAADDGRFVAFEAAKFDKVISGIAIIRDKFANEIEADADTEADALQQATLLRIGITLAAVLLATLMALFLTRSITRRVRAVSAKAREVATTQLPALVSALRDPRGEGVIPEVAPIEHAGSDELGELADAFNMVQSTLVEVAHEQVEVLRRGVSNIFVTMARRTRSLIDRQLALLDTLESDVDDPSVLANYYQLDHLATRMRRNSESLLVLANAGSRRRRTKATEVDDVVRAAIGEVEDYQRIDVLDLDHLRVRGDVVADISHLLAELLDNASSFSPPESRVTVSGRYADEHYLISIADQGVGVSADRLEELNDILSHPPIVGLSVEPTLGMSVVSLLAHKHGVQVRLVPSADGLLVEVVLPATVYEVIDATVMPGMEPTSNGHDRVAPDSAVDWSGRPPHTDTHARDLVTIEPSSGLVEPTVVPEPAVVTEPAVEPEWTFLPGPAIAPPEPEPVSAAVTLNSSAFTPPLSNDRMSGEFDRPPAPPEFATPPISRPFSDPTARPIPPRRTEHERQGATGHANASLPTRARGTGPDGPDRLAHLTASDGQPAGTASPTTPSALRASLNAFEAGRAGARPEPWARPPTLPTRDPGSAFDHDEVTPSTTQSRLDPEAIRERLRSFQQEFQLGRDGEDATGHDGDQIDLGGDR